MHKDHGLGRREGGCVIAVMRGKKSMKKCIVESKLAMKEKDLKKFGENFKSQWEEGFMLLPAGFSAKIVDDEWISAKKTLPDKETPVLVWYSYWAEDDDSEISYTYGFGWIDEDGKWVVHEGCEEILAWMPLPGAYYPEE